MTLRFASNPVPFAARTIALPAGHVLTDAQVAQLVAFHTAKVADVAVVCSDRPTLLAITKAFRAALPTAPTTPKAPVEVLHPIAPVAQTEASALAARWGTVVDGQAAKIVALEAEVVDLKAALEGAIAERNYLDTQVVELGEALAKKTRRSRAKAQAKAVAEAVTGEGYSDTEPAA